MGEKRMYHLRSNWLDIDYQLDEGDDSASFVILKQTSLRFPDGTQEVDDLPNNVHLYIAAFPAFYLDGSVGPEGCSVFLCGVNTNPDYTPPTKPIRVHSGYGKRVLDALAAYFERLDDLSMSSSPPSYDADLFDGLV